MKKIIILLVFSLSIFAFFKDVQALDLSDSGVFAITGVQDGVEYTDDLYIEITGGEYKFDGEIQTSEILFVNTIGYHTLELLEFGETTEVINFTILPRFTKEIDGLSFENKLSLELQNVGSIIVNDSLIENGTEFSIIGYYNMEVQGVNGYIKDYTFSILSSVLEFVDGNDYRYDVRFNTNTFYAVYINDIKQYGIVNLDRIGTYEVKVLGVNGYFKSFKFNIVLNNSYLIDESIYENYIRVDKMEATDLYIDNMKIENSISFISTIGNHEIRYEGKNGYEEIYNVTLSEGNINIFPEYAEKFSLKFDGYTAKLNGKKYTSEDIVTSAGYYTLDISGVNGYTNQYKFVILGNVDLVDNSLSFQAIQLDFEFKHIFVNGEPVEDYRITETGIYDIVLMGENGFTRSYEIEYVNNHIALSNGVTTVSFVFVGGLLITYALLAWRRFK